MLLVWLCVHELGSPFGVSKLIINCLTVSAYMYICVFVCVCVCVRVIKWRFAEFQS